MKCPSRMKKISHISVIKNLNAQLKEARALSQTLKNCLPEAWRDYCEVVRVNSTEKKCVISTSEQALLIQLRFMQAQLLEQLKKKSKAFKEIIQLECIYTPLEQKIVKEKLPAKRSKISANYCEDAAKSCSSPLKNALLKLAQTLRK